ncbi:hypothetical protein HPP92_025339 [Vanilla planifolia]|uniref:Formin-like protein n=1 Tax=Vanilla planifolia TaxID=51239 RepID=A0A835PF82_VANPL|nr:hypothetical protein HPP92_025339 [Vanilla planifolia]
MHISSSSSSATLLLLLLSNAHSWRILHEPFFQASPVQPAEAPTAPLPKYPLDSDPQPFFPEYPSPPPPSSSASNTPNFPGNLTSIILPTARSPPARRSSSGNLAAAILLPLLALVLISISLVFFLRRRCLDRQSHSAAGEKARFFPCSYSSTCDGGDGRNRKQSYAPPATDFLYVETVVESRGPSDADPPPAVVSLDQTLGSPELRPLPPLSRQLRQSDGNVDAGCVSEEEFYSLGDSSAGPDSSSRTEFTPVVSVLAMAAEKFGSQSSTPSYPTSSSGLVSSPAVSSPVVSSPPRASSPENTPSKSLDFRSDSRVFRDVGSLPSLSAVTPALPPPTSPSPPSSPQENPSFLQAKDVEKNSMSSSSVTKLLQSPPRDGLLSEKSLAFTPEQTKATPPPPPPPPLPPHGYWENKVRRPQLVQQPGLLFSKPIWRKGEKKETSEGEKNEEETRPKLKPLHWDKVRASSDRAMVWDQLKSSSFQVNEEMIETLFTCNVGKPTSKETSKKPANPSPKQENGVLDPKKSQNIAILLRAHNVTKEDVCESLLEGKTENLGSELLETLLKMAPSKEEEHKLREYKDDSPVKLGPAEKFLQALLDLPFAFKRLDAMLYITNFDSEVNYLHRCFETLEAACEELRSSRLFLKLLEAVLKTGNRMNVGTNRGDAHAFKLDTLLKLADVKGTDGKTTLLHFVVQEITRTEGSRLLASKAASAETHPTAAPLVDDLRCRKLGLRVVARLGCELLNVKKAASMDSEVLRSYVSKLAGGISKITDVLRLNEPFRSLTDGGGRRFHDEVGGFAKKAEDGIIKVQAHESVAMSLVKEITEYFHGNSAKEEAHPFRIFTVVRDFLTILDQVCKEVGRVTDHTIANTTRQLPVPVNPTVFPRIRALRPESSDDEGSASSSSSADGKLKF